MRDLAVPEFQDMLFHYARKMPFWQDTHRIIVAKVTDGMAAAYRTDPWGIGFRTTHFDINIGSRDSPTTCYILSLEVAEHQRRQGHGKAMVACIEDFCKDYGCDSIEVTASGDVSPKLYAATGFTRIKDGIVVFRKPITLK
ncbi:GNAT family N-acetyltransferase [Candidatus Woesearchaeota archaeon]|nr:GNAT family N-acetyltransferase [Candidatus Woesearchaeota archaeon]